MKLIMERWRHYLNENRAFSYNIIEDEADGGPTVAIGGLDISFQEMISQLNGTEVDFNDGDPPEQFDFSEMGGAEDAEDAELYMVRNGIAQYYVEAWAHMNGYSAERKGGFDEAKNKDGKEQGADGKACWKGYRYAGTEDGEDKCVPMEEDAEQLEEETDKDRMDCNKPRYIKKGEPGYGKKQKVVKACKDGEEKIVRFGDANMENKSDSEDNKSNFRSRHNCDDKKDKFSAGYWSCKDW